MNRVGLALMAAGVIFIVLALPLSGFALSIVAEPCPSSVSYGTASGSVGTGTLMSPGSTFSLVQQSDPSGAGVDPAFWSAWQAGNYGGLPALWQLTTPEGSISFILSPSSIASIGWSTGFSFLSSSQPYASFAGGGWSSAGACTVYGEIDNTVSSTSGSSSSSAPLSSSSSSSVQTTSSSSSPTATLTTQTTTTYVTVISGSTTTLTSTYGVTTTVTTTAPQGSAVTPPTSSPPSSLLPSFFLLAGLFMVGGGAVLAFGRRRR